MPAIGDPRFLTHEHQTWTQESPTSFVVRKERHQRNAEDNWRHDETFSSTSVPKPMCPTKSKIQTWNHGGDHPFLRTLDLLKVGGGSGAAHETAKSRNAASQLLQVAPALTVAYETASLQRSSQKKRGLRTASHEDGEVFHYVQQEKYGKQSNENGHSLQASEK